MRILVVDLDRLELRRLLSRFGQCFAWLIVVSLMIDVISPPRGRALKLWPWMLLFVFISAVLYTMTTTAMEWLRRKGSRGGKLTPRGERDS